jgi:hypothetical protein
MCTESDGSLAWEKPAIKAPFGARASTATISCSSLLAA